MRLSVHVRLSILLSALLCGAMPALAQAQGAARARGGDFLMVGLGPAMIPDYEGSNDYRLLPAPGAIARVGGIKLFYLGNRFSADLIADHAGDVWDVQLGPEISVGFNRSSTSGIDDARVRALGKVGAAVELGGYVGLARQGVVTSAYDRLAVALSVRHDVAGGHGGTVVTPTVSYLTPLSHKAMVALGFTAAHVDHRYADAYFSVTPAQATASGLPAFSARGGWKNWSLGAAGDVALTGDLTHGLSLIGGVMYTRLINDVAASPIVSIAGSRDQWMGGLGLAYTF